MTDNIQKTCIAIITAVYSVPTNLQFYIKFQILFSDGYVISTLWAALWSLAITNSYKKRVLQAVNLGNDTDTVAAVAGGLAGIVYGFEEIPKEWIENLKDKEIIEKCLSMDKEMTKEIVNCNSEKDHLDFDESMTVAARTKERGTKNVRNLCEG